MAQVTLYLPDDIARRIRRQARKTGKSLSAYMTALAAREVAPVRWPPTFARLHGSWSGDFTVEDAPPDEVVLK